MTLLVALRSGTRDAHDRLEDGLNVLERCRTRETYIPLLQAFRSLYAPLERAVASSGLAGEALPEWQQRRKTGWLDEDLAALGAAALPDREVPRLHTVEDVVGVCYVLEGATLGGAVVVQQLARDRDDPPPHRFFASYGRDRGAMWAAFRRHLVELDARGLDRASAVAAARRTFGSFEQACR